MKPRDFLPTMQRKVATTAVGPSALRNQGKGVLTAAQQFLADVSLSKVPRSDLNSFERWLDRETENLLNVFPIRGRPWGTARKALNLFLRDVLYNRYLCNKFGLMTIKPWLEIPLDSAVANGLKRLGQRGQLPRWPGLKRLTKPVSQIFQDFAGEFAEENEIERIHLDIYLWLENR